MALHQPVCVIVGPERAAARIARGPQRLHTTVHAVREQLCVIDASKVGLREPNSSKMSAYISDQSRAPFSHLRLAQRCTQRRRCHGCSVWRAEEATVERGQQQED